MVDVSYTPALGYMEIVPQRNAALLHIIQQHVAPGTIIHSDEWRAYSRVQSFPNVSSHQTVNHSVQFVNPVTGVHTENVNPTGIEQIKLKRMRGCHELELSSYLDEFMWRERYGTNRQAFENIIGDIAAQYPFNNFIHITALVKIHLTSYLLFLMLFIPLTLIFLSF